MCKSCHNKIHSWSVLSRCKNVNKIKKNIKLLNKKFKISQSLIDSINKLGPNAKKNISGILKKNLYDFQEILNIKISFKKLIKIKICIKKYLNKEIPSYISKKKFKRRNNFKRKSFYNTVAGKL